MASLVFPFLADTVTLTLSGYEQGVPGEAAPPLSPVISGVAGFSPDGITEFSQPGPWIESSSVRYFAAFDNAALKIRMYKTTDKSKTWNEMNAAGAPAVSNDATGTFAFFGSVRDTRKAVKKTYHFFWDTDQTVSFIPFDMTADTWGAKVKSTLAYLDLGVNVLSGFSVVHRASTNTIVIANSVNLAQFGNSFFQREYFAKFDLAGLAFDAAWTLFGSGTRLSDDLIQTVVAGGGYTAGSLVLNVASTGAPMPQVLTTFMTLVVCDPGTGTVKVTLNASVINSGTQWKVVANGADANALAGDLVIFCRNWYSLGAVIDSHDNIHFQHYVFASNTVLPSYLYHQVMRPNNSLTTPDLIKSVDRPQVIVNELARPLAHPIFGIGTELLFAYEIFTTGTLAKTVFVARAMASDMPAWTHEQLLPTEHGLAPGGAGPWEGFALTNLDVRKKVGAYYIQAVDPLGPGSAAVMAFIINNGAGLGWSAPNVIANFNWNQTPQSGITSFFAAAGPGGNPATGITAIIDQGQIAPVVLPDPDILCCFGRQIRVQKCGKQAYPMSRGPKALYP